METIEDIKLAKQRKESSRSKKIIATGVSILALSGGGIAFSNDAPAEDHRYPNPPTADTLRLQHIAESDDDESTIAEKFAKNIKAMNMSGVHLEHNEVYPHTYQTEEGVLPENGMPVPKDPDTVSKGERVVADIPVKDLYDK